MLNPSGITGAALRTMNSLRGKGDGDPEAIKAVAKEMESLFAYELIKAMRATTGNSSKNTLGGDTCMTMFDMELSRLFAERGLGLRDLLERGLNKMTSSNLSDGHPLVNGKE